MNRFEDRTVIVTGGSGGIGRATCRRFASEGARVAVFARNLGAAQDVVAAVRDEGGVAKAFRCDVTDRASIDVAVAATQADFGPIDVLVNNDLPGALLFFASDDAAYVTGQVLSVSGGLTMHG